MSAQCQPARAQYLRDAARAIGVMLGKQQGGKVRYAVRDLQTRVAAASVLLVPVRVVPGAQQLFALGFEPMTVQLAGKSVTPASLAVHAGTLGLKAEAMVYTPPRPEQLDLRVRGAGCVAVGVLVEEKI
jgi:hypothetical protein